MQQWDGLQCVVTVFRYSSELSSSVELLCVGDSDSVAASNCTSPACTGQA